MKTQYKHLLQRTYLVLVFGFMYLPIAVLIAYSFNENKSRAVFTGFSLKWYASLFHNEMILSALGLSLVLAFVSAIIATVLGTLATIGINSMSRKAQLIINNISYVPVVNPEIITGVALFLLFVSLGITQGFTTVVLAHITFCVPYVVLSVLPKLRQMNPSLYEAALDLGATPMQALRKIIIPEIKPGIISGFILSFTLSFDDFVISLFTIGNEGLQTLSTYIYADARKGGLTPELRPLTSLIFIVVLLLLVIVNLRAGKSAKNNE